MEMLNIPVMHQNALRHILTKFSKSPYIDLPLDEYVSCDVLTATREDFDRNATPLMRIVKEEGIRLNAIAAGFAKKI